MDEKIFKLNILVVDDEENMCMGVKRCLANYMVEDKDFADKIVFDVSSVTNGTEAIEFISKNKPDIVLLDYKLPDMNGLEILEKFSGSNFIAIIITAFASIDVAIAATKKGAFDFLAKPFAPDELREVLRKAAKTAFISKKARALEEEKKSIRFEFISILAHELKSPLAAIEGYLRLVDERIKGDDLSAYDSMISRSIERIVSMRKLIMDILDLTRLESGRGKRVIENISLKDITDSVVDGLKPSAEKKNVSISIDVDDISINADKTEMEMLLSNLLSNAIKYNKENGSVNLKIKRDADYINIECSDTGIGMKEDDVKKLFNEFVRIKNEYTRNIEGSGLGLSIVKKIVLLYNGEIKVESEYLKGTKFIIKIKPQLAVEAK
ncbi:MAG: response regulator [Elusimicrobiales bacterium]|jgi:two-component system sensor histidine kinase/response regulator|nr:response regulator [Elusimicrobiales bacterium]NLH39990.1 response regulator [Elusimicrobiota bacterium]